MDISLAKKSLYNKLKSYAEVLGVGIREKDGTEFIVIFLSEASNIILENIPDEFEGNKVETEIKGEIKVS